MKSLKPIFTMIVSALILAPISQLQAGGHDDYNPNLLIFQGEIQNYIELAREIQKSGSNSSKSDQDQQMNDLIATAGRIASVYFSEKDETNKQSLDNYLGTTLKKNTDIKNYFLFIGNSFIDIAQKLMESQRAHETKIKRISTTIGVVVGVVAGGGWLYLKGRGIIGKGITGVDLLLAAGAVVGLGAAGFGVGTAIAYQLPVDRAVKNAKDFKARYPHGEDFIDDVEKGSPDLDLLLSVIQG